MKYIDKFITYRQELIVKFVNLYTSIHFNQKENDRYSQEMSVWEAGQNNKQDWTINEIRRLQHFFASLLLRLYEAGTFFIPSWLGGIPA